MENNFKFYISMQLYKCLFYYIIKLIIGIKLNFIKLNLFKII